jgi:4-amino-4-deoxy-L-arabinose transferase
MLIMNQLNEQTPMNVNKRHAFLLMCFFLIAYIIPLGVRDLAVPDETRYAEIPREMIADGDWISPHLNGVKYFEKPVLGYWVHAGAIMIFGENNFAVRLPSAMAVGLSALLIYILVYQVCRKDKKENDMETVLAPLIYLSCFEVFGVGNTAVLDNLFSFFLTATIISFYLSTEALRGSAREKRFLIASGVACGLAFLTKGFLAFAVPVLALAPYLIWQRRFIDLFRMSWLPILTAVLVVLPWSILIHFREPDFWNYFFWNEHIRRFMADNAQHKESFWFFFLTAPGMVIPWTFMIPAMLSGLRGRLNVPGPDGRLIRLSVCWMVLPFLFFSFSNGKLLTYILPCIPPFAILMAFGTIYFLEKKDRKRLFQGGALISAMVFFLILFVFVFIQFAGYQGFHPYNLLWKPTLAIGGLIFFILLNVLSFQSQLTTDKLLLFGIAPVVLFFIAPFIIPDLTVEVTSPGILLKRYQQSVSDKDTIISDQRSIRAVCWYLKRKDVFVLGGTGELEYGLMQKESAGRLLDMKSAINLINQHRGKTVLVARTKNIREWKGRLPQPVFRDTSGPQGYTFWRF